MEDIKSKKHLNYKLLKYIYYIKKLVNKLYFFIYKKQLNIKK